MDDPFAILDVSPDASAEEIEAAYQRKRATVIARAEAEDVERVLRTLDQAFAEARGAAQNQFPLATLPSSPVSALNTLANMNHAQPAVATRICNYCGTANPVQATRCQNCSELLSKPCPHCGHPLDLAQSVCDRCHTVVSEYRQNTKAVPAVEAKRIDKERSESSEYAHEVGVAVDAERRAAIKFWLLVIMFGIIFVIVILSVVSNSGSAWR